MSNSSRTTGRNRLGAMVAAAALFVAAIAGTVLATSYIGLLGSFILQCRWFPGKHSGLLAVAFRV